MQSFNLIEMWHNMAPLAKAVNVLLAICSIYSLWVIIDRFIGLRSVRLTSTRFVLSLRDQLRYRNIDGAMQLATHQNESPVARMVKEALTEYREGLDAIRVRSPHEAHDYDSVEAVERVIERVKEREQADMKRGLGGLASISSAAPFIGLFGTVVGIINAFQAMAATGQGGLGAVSAGISEALFTTAVGLLVAIPAVMTFNYYSTSIERFMVDMNGVGSELISFVLRESVSAPAGAQPQAAHGPASMHPYPSNQPPPVHHPSNHPSNHPPPMHPSNQPPSVHHGHHGPGSGHSPVAPPVSGYPPPGYPPR